MIKSYLDKILANNKARFSQFLRLEQNIRQESFGTTSIIKPPILSGSSIATSSEYLIIKLYYLTLSFMQRSCKVKLLIISPCNHWCSYLSIILHYSS